jgi:threonine dehydrogenase-like Zn-dependent dehydrogenase
VEKHGTMQAFVKGYANERGRWDAENQMHVHEGVLWGYPIPLGNMQFGEVIEVGADVAQVRIGDSVAVSAPFQPEVSVDLSEVFPMKADTPWKSAALQDPGEFALGAIRDGHVRLGDRVVVFGMGAIGLTCVQMAKIAGASQVIAVDALSNRLTAAESCGADVVVDARSDDVGGQIRELTGKKGVDVAIDFSGARPALQAAIRGVGYLGRIVCGAFPPPFDAGLDLGGEGHMNRPSIIFSRACSDPNPEHPRWDWNRIRREVWALIVAGRLNGEPIVDDPVAFATLAEAYPKIAANPAETIKLSTAYP